MMNLWLVLLGIIAIIMGVLQGVTVAWVVGTISIALVVVDIYLDIMGQ